MNRQGVIILYVIVSPATFPRQITSSGRSCFIAIAFFCLHSTVVTLSKPNPFVGLKHSRTEKSPWIKSKTKLGPKPTTAKTYAPGTWLRHCRFLAKLNCLHTVNPRGSVISLARGFSSRHIPLCRRDMRINLKIAKPRTRFSRESLLLKRINRVCRFDGFPWNVARIFPDRYRTKACRRFPLF